MVAKSRAQQLADAYLIVATANHYMVGIVEQNIKLIELSDAEQILISRSNAENNGNAATELALDLLQAELERRTRAYEVKTKAEAHDLALLKLIKAGAPLKVRN
jgi:hypothetical protein